MSEDSLTLNSPNSIIAKLNPDQEYKVYPIRFFIAFLFCLSCANAVTIWLVWVPIQSLLVQDYSLSLPTINFCTLLIANITILPTSIYGNYILDEYGLRLGMIIGCLLTGAGLWIRTLCEDGFHWIFIGQLVASLGQPFFYNTPQKVSQVWFGPKERTVATAVITGFFTFSMAIGTVLPSLMMNLESTNPTSSIQELQGMMMELAVGGTICFIPVFLFFKKEPPTPPSRAAAAEKLHVFTAVKELAKNKNYMILLAGASIIVASLVNAVSVMQVAVIPWGITSMAFSIYSAFGIVAGLITSVIVGVYVSRTQKYRKPLLGLCFLGAIFIPLTYLGAVTGSSFLWGILFISFAASQCPLLAVGLEFCLELSFPVPEATSAGIIIVLGSILSTGESLVIDWILGENPTEWDSSLSFLIMTIVQALGCLTLIYVKEDLRRMKYEKSDKVADVRTDRAVSLQAQDDLKSVDTQSSNSSVFY